MTLWHDVIQNSEEWFNLRLGKITSSNYGSICANMGKAFGDPAIRYARQKALEIVTGKRDESSSYSNSYMERGHELEPIASELYEDITFNSVSNGGFYHTNYFDRIQYGDSPDGLIGMDGCIEIKCVIPNTHWARIEKGGYDTSYKWQIQGHLFVSGRQWCDFISYCPEFAPGKELYIYRVERDEEMIWQLRERLEEFQGVIKDKIKLLT